MKKLVILRSVTGQARRYADRHFRHFTWFDDLKTALATLSQTKDRPWFVVVNGGNGDLGLGSRAAGLGYIVQTKGVP